MADKKPAKKSAKKAVKKPAKKAGMKAKAKKQLASFRVNEIMFRRPFDESWMAFFILKKDL